MTFFDITPAGAFMNAIDAASKSDDQARRMEEITTTKTTKTIASKNEIRARLRELFAPVENQTVRTA